MCIAIWEIFYLKKYYILYNGNNNSVLTEFIQFFFIMYFLSSYVWRIKLGVFFCVIDSVHLTQLCLSFVLFLKRKSSELLRKYSYLKTVWRFVDHRPFYAFLLNITVLIILCRNILLINTGMINLIVCVFAPFSR